MTSGTIRSELRLIGIVSQFGGGQLGSTEGDSLSTRKRWGYLQGTAIFPGPDSSIHGEYEPDELQAIQEGAAALGISGDHALSLLGAATVDVPLNETAYWKNIPRKVWEFSASGYSVLKKWLSYREFAILGRNSRSRRQKSSAISPAELLLGLELDSNYQAIESATQSWIANTDTGGPV